MFCVLKKKVETKKKKLNSEKLFKDLKAICGDFPFQTLAMVGFVREKNTKKVLK